MVPATPSTLFVLLFYFTASYVCSPSEFVVPAIDVPKSDTPFISTRLFLETQLATAREIAVQDINNSPSLLPNTTLLIDVFPLHISSALAVEAMINFSSKNQNLVIGNPTSLVSTATGIVGDVYNVAQLSSLATTSKLSNNNNYPYFSRLATSSVKTVSAIKASILYYAEIQGRGWTDVAVLSTADEYGLNLAFNFIQWSGPEVNILTFREYLSETLTGVVNYQNDLEEIKNSGVRVIVVFIFDQWEPLITAANDEGLIGDNYVWYVSDLVVGADFQTETGSLLSRGLIGTFQHFPDTELLAEFVARWAQLDPNEYPTAGPGLPPTPYALIEYDMVMTAAIAIDTADRMGLLEDNGVVSGSQWTEIIRNITFEGLSGAISFDANGDRDSTVSLLYYVPETSEWVPTALWNDDGYTLIKDVVWFSNSTQIPDLDIRESFGYWSCHDKEKRVDVSGKTVTIHTPDGSDVDDIDSDYLCDQYIDCHNLSDEGSLCSKSYVELYIIFGVITGVLIGVALLLTIFVLVFGLILKYRRLRVASPLFLILMLISIIVGYSSIFAWYGKPHPVACGFQPWLLGFSVLSMISALTVKTVRIWRIFRFPLKKIKISDAELFILWGVIMIPALFILILWSVISTPTASLEHRDEKDHYVCTTGGFTGEPGGYVFFALYVAYCSLVLLFGAVLSVVVRNVPSQFNESKLVAISIYNLALLSVVIIPVYMALIVYEPFIAWILRTCAVLYAFTATMVLQFLPKTIGIVIFDRCRNIKVFKTTTRFTGDRSATRY